LKNFSPTYRAIRHVAYGIRRIARVNGALGTSGALRFALMPLLYEIRRLLAVRDGAARVYTLTARQCEHPLRLRAGSSDLDVFRQIFIEQEYHSLSDLDDPRSMIDLGANVGFSSAWFLSRYPSLGVIAVEPDPDNVAAMRVNLAPFGDRVEIRESGVWSRPVPLRVLRGVFGDKREWATKVREAQAGETPDLIAVGMPELIAATGRRRVDLLKIDIEGAEGELFANPPVRWLDQVENIVVEAHGADNASIVSAAVPGGEFSRSASGDLIFYRRQSAPGPL